MKILVLITILFALSDASLKCSILESLSKDKISENCFKQLNVTCNNSTLSWKMFDASSKFLLSGMSYRALVDYGNFQECLSIDHTESDEHIIGKYCGASLLVMNVLLTGTTKEVLIKNGIDVVGPGYEKHFVPQEKFDVIGKQFRDYIIPGIPFPISKLSMCIPDACTPQEVGTFYLYDLLAIGNFSLIGYTGFPCETKYSNTELEAGDIAVIVLLVVVLLLMITSTSYDYICNLQEKEPRHQLLIAFSVIYNWKKLMQTSKNRTEQIQIFNGMRFISMAWVVAFHGAGIYQAKMGDIANAPAIAEWEANWTVRYIRSALLAVDTFFFMSGFLLAFSYLKKNTEKGFIRQVLNVPEMYLHRYLRLTPAAGMMFLIFITIYRMLGSGPVWTMVANVYIDACKKYWWQFFLYVQNYTNEDNMCVNPAWYLSADMQMFFFAPIVLIPTAMFIKKKFMQTILCLSCLTVIWVILPMIQRYFIDQEVGNIYTSHERFNNFLIGIIFGAVMRFKNDKPYIFTPLQNILMWILVMIVSLFIIIYWHDVYYNYEFVKYTIFMGLYKPLWCLCLCFMVYSCYHGHGGFVEWLLSRESFQILGKLCYSMYVMHVMVISYMVGYIRNGTYFSRYMLFYRFCGHFIVTMAVALIWVLAFEFPMLTIDKYIFGDSTKPKGENERSRTFRPKFLNRFFNKNK